MDFQSGGKINACYNTVITNGYPVTKTKTRGGAEFAVELSGPENKAGPIGLDRQRQRTPRPGGCSRPWVPRGYASSVIIAKNSCSLISPSWSRSNSSIIACLEGREPRISITVLDMYVLNITRAG